MAEREHGAASAGDPVIDLTRTTSGGAPPVPGAQWDELHRRWEVWNDAEHLWQVVGDDASVRPGADDEHLPPLLARELLIPEEQPAVEDRVIDLDRAPRPPQPVPGAQWNEVAGRWERWDEGAGAWVEARAAATSDRTAP